MYNAAGMRFSGKNSSRPMLSLIHYSLVIVSFRYLLVDWKVKTKKRLRMDHEKTSEIFGAAALFKKAVVR